MTNDTDWCKGLGIVKRHGSVSEVSYLSKERSCQGADYCPLLIPGVTRHNAQEPLRTV
ncbi:hypothetical protein [Sulfitobacter mediterraneus]|uniref:hypothetical protein n=1 Tax=Sulfitobacter mediterraneus TaxID=83219 RepID=UPI0019394D78|nr:hypothetical protein [Sulfitobacter mediterraneus]